MKSTDRGSQTLVVILKIKFCYTQAQNPRRTITVWGSNHHQHGNIKSILHFFLLVVVCLQCLRIFVYLCFRGSLFIVLRWVKAGGLSFREVLNLNGLKGKMLTCKWVKRNSTRHVQGLGLQSSNRVP